MGYKKKKIIAIIPARYHSTRFPGKPLATIQGKPMIQWVCERAREATILDDLWVATDDSRIEQVCQKIGVHVFRSQKEHQSGTDRIIEAFHHLEAHVVVNIQGDEPLLQPDIIEAIVKPFFEKTGSDIAVTTPVKKIETIEEITDPNIVKAVLSQNGTALYFSRCPIPAYFSHGSVMTTLTPSTITTLPYYKHIGLYAYSGSFLREFPQLRSSSLEKTEKLEQLRILDNGYNIRCVKVLTESIGVDTPEDILKVEKFLEADSDTSA